MKNHLHNISSEFLIHLFVWVFLFGLPPMAMGRSNEEFETGRLIRVMSTPVSLAIVFYLNYFLIVPKYLFRKENRRFILINCVLCISMVIVLHFWFELCNIYFPTSHRPPKRFESTGFFIFFRIRDLIIYGFSAALAAAIRLSQKWHSAEIGRQNAEIGRQKAEIEKAETELKNLRNQINPHFLLNTLNNIYALIAFDSDKAQQAVMDLSRLLRHILYDNNQEYIPLNREIEFIKNYVELMRIRLASHVSLDFKIDVAPENNIMIAPLIFISLIENAFKHGISPVKPSFINISISSREDGTVKCLIENSNFPKKRNDISGSGIGLQQVNRRLDLIYPGRYEWTKGTNDDNTVYTSCITLKTGI